jgi:hypothetical protein
MKYFKLLLLLFIIIIFAGLGVFYVLRVNKKSVTQTELNNQETVVGGDKDEHGCILSAGYSWCEIKQKCLRPFEESCEEDSSVSEDIKALLVAKNNWNADEIKVTVSENDGTYAKGGVGAVTPQGGGGLWFAAKVNGKWNIVYDGNGIITCDSLTNYPDFPASMIPECYDASTNQMVER